MSESVPKPRSMIIERGADGSPRRGNRTVRFFRKQSQHPCLEHSRSLPVVSQTRIPTSLPTLSERSTTEQSEHQEQQQQQQQWTWRMKDQDLNFPPPFHYKENHQRTSMEISLPVQQVLQRIAAFMRIKSITCVFHSIEGRIDCWSPNYVHFVVFLWRGGGSGGKNEQADGKSVLVQVERRQGCSIEMQRLRQSLFHAIRSGDEPTAEPIDPYNMRASKRICPLVKKMYQEQAKKHHQSSVSLTRVEEECRDDMTTCHDLLESCCDDQQRLGMENLAFLTDPATVTWQTAECVARVLLYSSCPFGVSLRDELIAYFRHPERLKQQQYSSDIETQEFSEGHSFAVMHRLALRALTNALQVLVATRKDSSGKKLDLTSDFWRDIARTLAVNLVNSVDRPEEAALSAKCILLLEDLAPDAIHLFVGDRLLPHLVKAHRFGEAHHFALEQASQDLISRLGGGVYL